MKDVSGTTFFSKVAYDKICTCIRSINVNTFSNVHTSNCTSWNALHIQKNQMPVNVTSETFLPLQVHTGDASIHFYTFVGQFLKAKKKLANLSLTRFTDILGKSTFVTWRSSS